MTHPATLGRNAQVRAAGQATTADAAQLPTSDPSRV
jgi:hypothetical protein